MISHRRGRPPKTDNQRSVKITIEQKHLKLLDAIIWEKNGYMPTGHALGDRRRQVLGSLIEQYVNHPPIVSSSRLASDRYEDEVLMHVIHALSAAITGKIDDYPELMRPFLMLCEYDRERGTSNLDDDKARGEKRLRILKRADVRL